jgi:protein-disulfide isomerase
MGDRLVFAFRNFPLAEVHPHAIAAALAAEVAGLYGQFWQMHDLLLSGDEPHLVQADLREYAEKIGVPPHKVVWPATQFVEERVEADFNSGVRSGVRGTPTFFVDGRLYRGDTTVAALLDALDGR